MIPVTFRLHHPQCAALLQAGGAMTELLQLHAQILRNAFFFSDPFAAGQLLNLFANALGNLHYATKIFRHVDNPDTFAWNSLIRAHAASPSPSGALKLFSEMVAASERKPNSHTLVFVLKACGRLGLVREGEQVHGFIIKLGLEREVFCSNSLISMYANCGKIKLSELVFKSCAFRDVVSWSALLSGYLNCGLPGDARKVFDEMPDRGIVSWNAMINGYARKGDLVKAREMFDRMPERDAESWNTMISGYARCGQLDCAVELFWRMEERNVVSWSLMISACVQGGAPAAAVEVLGVMWRRGVRPNWAAVVSLLSACASLSNLSLGRCIHEYIERSKMKLDGILGTTLINMYSKCGCIDGAAKVFDVMESHDVFSWTAMIGGLVGNGRSEKALEFFKGMIEKKVKPNEITFVEVLSACNQLGDANLAREYFESMKLDYGLEPEAEHYGCLVDALARAGMVAEAAAVAAEAPGGGADMWGTLLGACSVRGDVCGGEYAANRLTDVGDGDGGEYVLMANLYAGKGQWEKAKRMRELMKDKGMSKLPGRSFVEVDR